jgi:hypothetical protein
MLSILAISNANNSQLQNLKWQGAPTCPKLTTCPSGLPPEISGGFEIKELPVWKRREIYVRCGLGERLAEQITCEALKMKSLFGIFELLPAIQNPSLKQS